MSRIVVSGNNLQWIDTIANVTRSICGAIPNPVPSGFSGLAAGKIWIAQASTDPYLYYSDSVGQTRFIAGIERGNTSLPAGRIYTNDGTCTAITELWWTTPSGSVTQSFSARSENAIASEIIYMNLSVLYNGTNSSASLYATSTAPRSNTTISGVVLEQYLSDIPGCNGTCGGCSPSTTNISLTLNAGESGPKYQALTIGGTALSYRINTSSLQINGTASIGGFAGGVCVDIDPTYAFTFPDVCVNLGSSPVLKCGQNCTQNSDCSTATDGCTVCSSPGVGGVCVEPGTGGGGGLGCNSVCDENNNLCDQGGSCPNCVNGYCTGTNQS